MVEGENNPLREYLGTETGNDNDTTDGLAENLIDAPRVGGKRGKVYWTGGLKINLPRRPKSAYALRPEDYKGLMNTEENCKAVLPERFRLYVSGKKKTSR